MEYLVSFPDRRGAVAALLPDLKLSTTEGKIAARDELMCDAMLDDASDSGALLAGGCAGGGQLNGASHVPQHGNVLVSRGIDLRLVQAVRL